MGLGEVADPAKDVETRRLGLRTAAGIKTGRSRHGVHVQVQNPARGRGRGNGERITPGYSNCVSAEWSFGGQARVREAADDPGCATAVGIDARAVVVPGYGSAARGDGRGLTHLLRQAVKVAERIRNWDTGTRPLKQHSLGRKSLHRGACSLTQTSMHCGGSICRTSCACPGSAGWAVSPRPRCPEPGNRYLEWRNCRRPLPTPGPWALLHWAGKREDVRTRLQEPDP